MNQCLHTTTNTYICTQAHFVWFPFCLEGEEFVQSVFLATSYWGARAIIVLFSSFLLPILSLVCCWTVLARCVRFFYQGEKDTCNDYLVRVFSHMPLKGESTLDFL